MTLWQEAPPIAESDDCSWAGYVDCLSDSDGREHLDIYGDGVKSFSLIKVQEPDARAKDKLRMLVSEMVRRTSWYIVIAGRIRTLGLGHYTLEDLAKAMEPKEDTPS
jgi:hypothetical protein